MIHSLLAAAAIVTTIAGVPGVTGHLDGAANVALFNKPTHITVDTANGDVYVTDRLNGAVRKVSGGTVSTYDPVAADTFDFGGPINGGIVIEPPGQYPQSPFYGRGLFIASSGDHVIEQRDIFGAPFVHDVAFVGARDLPGFYNGPVPVDQPKPAFNMPTALAIDRRHYAAPGSFQPRYIYIADTGNGAVRKLTREINFEGEYYATRIDTVATGFLAPRGLAFAPDGTLYVSDAGYHVIWRVEKNGEITVVAGQLGVAGNADGAPGLLNVPTGIDVDDAGNVYIADTANQTIRRLRGGVLKTVAGLAGQPGFADGDALTAQFNGPVGVQVAPGGGLIVADTSNHVIRKITFVTPPEQPRRRGVRH